MDIKVTQKKEQPLLSRTLIRGFVGFEGASPKRVDLRKTVASAMSVPESQVAVTKIKNVFGQKKAFFESNIYSSSKDLAVFESVVVQRRLGIKEKKAAKEAKK